MSDLPLTLAIGDYVHTRELAAGRIKPEGIDLRVLNHPFELIAYRFLASQEWEVSEFSLATYCTFVAQGNSPMIGLPIFPSRVFRHGSIYVPRDSKIKSPADLKGKRIGIPQWTQTAVTYVRGWLQHDIGVPLTSIEWIQAGVNDAGRKEMAPIMHVVVMRRDVFEATRWIARNLLEAFEKAKRACMPALYQGQISFLPTAWSHDHIEQTNRVLFPDGDPWPYGIEKNRKTLEPFLTFCHEQGVTKRKLTVEELFPKEVHGELKI